MALGLFDAGKRRRRRAAEALYGAAMAQSRRPELFRELEIPDTLDGRFDALVLHMVLVLRRLKREGEAARELSQELFDLMFADMDRSLREMGVGDHSIGRRVKQMISAFYGRAQAYEEALDGGEDTLETALSRNVYRDIGIARGKLEDLAGHIRGLDDLLAAQAGPALLAGNVSFETPDEANARKH